MIFDKLGLELVFGWIFIFCFKYLGISMDNGLFLLLCVFIKVVNFFKLIMVFFIVLEYVCFEVIFKVFLFIR